jgi:PKD repeat protein
VYIVTLAVGNSVCDDVLISDTILISEKPTVDLAAVEDACGQIAFTPNPTFSDRNRIDKVTWTFPEETGRTTFDNFFPSQLSINTSGDFQISVKVENSCGSAEASEAFSVLTPIKVDAELSADTICGLPAKVQVTNKSTGDQLNYTWRVEGEFSSNTSFVPTEKNPQFTFKDTGVYVIIQEVNNEVCGTFSWSDTLTLMTKPQPILTGQDRFCEQVSLTPIVNYLKYRVDSVQWAFPGADPAVSSALFPKSVGYSKGGEYIYTLRAFNFCGSTALSDTIFIDTIPMFNLGPTDTICLNEGIYQMPPVTPIGGIWLDSLQRVGVVTQTGQFNPDIARGGITSLGYAFTTGACTVSEYKDVWVVDLNYVDAGPDINTCISDSIVVLKGGIPGGGWYLGEGVADTLLGYFTPNKLAAGMYELSYNYQLAGTKCIQRDPFTAYVRALPVPGFQVTDSICVQVPVVLSNQSQGANRYRWRVDAEKFYEEKNPRHMFVDTGLHSVHLTAVNEYGCVDSIAKELYVSAPPIVSFEKDTTMGCAVLPVQFTNKTIGFKSVQYAWDFGNGLPINKLQQPGTVYYEQGLEDTTYFIKLTATNVCGTTSYQDSVIVFPKPISDLRINQKFNCTPSRVVFNNLTKGLPDRFEWYLDGALFSKDSIAPDQILRAAGPDNAMYKLELIAFNECGTDTSVQIVTVKPDSIRTFFEVDLTEGCEPLRVSFKNSSSPDSLVVYNWFFSQNDHTSNVKDTSFVFFAARDTVTEYRVTLLANNGCSENMFSTNIRVYPSPEVSIIAPDYACAQADVPFSSPAKEINGYLWEFGDQTTSSETYPVHAFREPGTYPVHLTAYSERNGCPGKASRDITIRPLPSPQLDVNPLFGCPPHQVTLKNTTDRPDRYYYLWDFGDGGSKVGANPGTYVYQTSGEYPITLRATDQFGCAKDTTYVTVKVFPKPKAGFIAEPTEPCGLPQTICFQNASLDSDAYAWSFGNGQPVSNLRNPCTKYSKAGVYPVQLIARNSFLCGDTLSTTVEAFDIPVADFEVMDPVLCEDATFQMQNLSRNATYHRWSIAGLPIDTTQQPTVLIRQPGIYSVVLIVGNGSGCMDTLNIPEYLEVLPRPVAGLQIEKDPTLPPSTFQFLDKSSPDAISFGWDLGGGVISRDKNTTYRYISRFDRDIAHWVTNEYDCSDTVFQRLDLDTLRGLFIPNILEPSSTNSEKQFFTPKGIGLESWHLAIYTRSGQLVWETTALDEEGSPTESWNGGFLNGEIPAGAFVWKVHYARFIDGSYWAGMPDEKGKPRRHGVLYLVR